MQKRAPRTLVAVLAGALLLMGPYRQSNAATTQFQQAHACVYDHQALRTTSHRCRPRARAYPPQVVGKVRHAIYDSALTFGMPYPVLLKIAQCESALNPHASNGSRFGLFQFAPDTFKRAASQLRASTGLSAHSYWNPLDASYVAGYLFATGQSSSWSCELQANATG